jgi:predicted ester cyclase
MAAEELAHGLFRILETGDPILAARVVASDNQNREARSSPPACSIPGPAGALASGVWMRSAFTGLRFPILDIGEGPGQVWVRLRMQGRQDGPFVLFRGGTVDLVIPPTGKEIDAEQIHILGVRDNQVVSHQAVRDDITMLSQLGVFPPRPGMTLRLVAWRATGRADRAARAVSTAAAAEASRRH